MKETSRTYLFTVSNISVHGLALRSYKTFLGHRDDDAWTLYMYGYVLGHQSTGTAHHKTWDMSLLHGFR